jgi:two-component sensor histidine kinase
MAQLFFDITDRKNAEVRQAALFDELNHRVKNNLTLVSAVLEMKARGSDNAEVRDQLLKAVNRVQSIAQVHTALYKGGRTHDVDFPAYLQELCQSIARSLAPDDRIRVSVAADAAHFSVDLAITLGMVVNELLTNAVKYAYGPMQTGEILVSLTRDADGMTLSVADGGAGLPSGAEQESAGLGMRLVRSLVGQAKGVLTIRRDPGTTFEIRLPSEALED